MNGPHTGAPANPTAPTDPEAPGDRTAASRPDAPESRLHGSYLDAATAAPLHPVARQAWLAALADGWADPGRLYSDARRAAQLLGAARSATAAALGTREDEVIFCGSGTEAVRLGIEGILTASGRREGLVHSAVEHSAVLHLARQLTPDRSAGATHDPHDPAAADDQPARAALAGPAVAVPVDRLGRVRLDAFAAAVAAPGVQVGALQSANHEVGTLQPIAEAAGLCAAAAVPLVVDAAQSVGRVPVPPGWSVLTASARKWGGPAGVGILAVRRGTRWQWPGPPPGAANLPAIVAAAASLRAALAEAGAEAKRLSALVDRIRHTVTATVPDVEVIGDPDQRLPHIVTFSCLYLDGEALLHALDRRGFAVSSGSACTSDVLRPSHVLAAMGALTHGNVRVSLHREVRESDVDRFLAVLPAVIAELRAEAGVTGL